MEDDAAATPDGRVAVGRAVWYGAGAVITLLVVRVGLFLAGAHGTGVSGPVLTLSGFFAAPFTGIFPTPQYGAGAWDAASVVGIVVYALIAWGIGRLLTIDGSTSTNDM